jgi:hypothetical protein
MQVRAAHRGRQQNLIGVRPVIAGELIGPITDLPRPRRAQLPPSERARDHRVRGQPPRPPGRPGRRAPGDLRDRPQPGLGAELPIGLIPVLRRERGQDPRPGGGVLGFGLFQADEGLGLRARPETGSITGGEVTQPGRHHRQRLHRARGRGRLAEGAHGRDHLPGMLTLLSITSSIVATGSDKMTVPKTGLSARASSRSPAR